MKSYTQPASSSKDKVPSSRDNTQLALSAISHYRRLNELIKKKPTPVSININQLKPSVDVAPVVQVPVVKVDLILPKLAASKVTAVKKASNKVLPTDPKVVRFAQLSSKASAQKAFFKAPAISNNQAELTRAKMSVHELKHQVIFYGLAGQVNSILENVYIGANSNSKFLEAKANLRDEFKTLNYLTITEKALNCFLKHAVEFIEKQISSSYLSFKKKDLILIKTKLAELDATKLTDSQLNKLTDELLLIGNGQYSTLPLKSVTSFRLSK